MDLLRKQLIVVVIALSLAGSGCRRRNKDPVDADPKQADKSGGASGVGAKPGEGTGPKIMGYQFWSRNSFGIMQGTYTDEQDNKTVDRTRASEEVKIPGQRYIIEHYPIVIENFPNSKFGYALIELRDEKPEPDFWEQRVSALILGGYILPKRKIIAPLVGVHVEFNKISLDQDESPEVAKSDVRAWLLGVHWRQKVWGTGQWMSAFYNGRIHLMNPGQPSWGYEYELGIGAALAYDFLRTDLGLGWMSQTYSGTMATEDGDLVIKSQYQALTATLTIWI